MHRVVGRPDLEAHDLGGVPGGGTHDAEEGVALALLLAAAFYLAPALIPLQRLCGHIMLPHPRMTAQCCQPWKQSPGGHRRHISDIRCGHAPVKSLTRTGSATPLEALVV